MIPKSLSASALKVAHGCMSRYHAESFLRTAKPANSAASLGTSIHAAIEWYVRAVYIEKSKPESWDALLALFRMHFCAEFETVEPDGHEMYADGLEMLRRWFDRTSFKDREVISVEEKLSFNVPTSAGDIPFNYIFDRFDRRTDEEDCYEVVDLKSQRALETPRGLHEHIQARVYGLAAQIQIPTAKKIWVRLDLLRHDSVATVFTRQENIATWHFIKAMAEKIIAADPADLPETLNSECNYCVRKTSCEKLQSNVAGGGVYSHNMIELVDMRAKMAWQMKALKSALDDIDKVILTAATEQEQLEFEGSLATAQITQSRRRAVDVSRVAPVVGDALFLKYGGMTMTMTDFGKLLKSPELNPSQLVHLESMIYMNPGDAYVKSAPKTSIEG